MLHKRTIHALKALLELADQPLRWRSSTDLAAAQALPEALLEQVLLQLRRAGLLEARRGRLGGYRLSRSANAIAVAEVVALMEPPTSMAELPSPASPSTRVTRALERRLYQAVLRSLETVNLEDLLFDLRSAEAAGSEGGGLLLG